MYTAEQIAENIKKLAKERNIPITKMLEDCELNKNALYTIAKGSMPKIDTISRIANYFKVSVDYLISSQQQIKEKEEVTADDIFCAIILIMENIKKTVIEYGFNPHLVPYAELRFFDNDIILFIQEYQKIENILKDESYPQYLKDSLKQALMNKYKQCSLHHGEIIDFDDFEIISEEDVPF